MVAESRAARLDLYARTKFTKEGKQIVETRAHLDDLLDEVYETAAHTTVASLHAAATQGLVDWG
jgi:hypothetical protein